MAKKAPYSSIHEFPRSLIVGGQPRTSAFLIVRWTVIRTEKAVRESDRSINPETPSVVRRSSASAPTEMGTSPERPSDDELWNGMVAELSQAWETLPASLSSVADQVSAVLGKPVAIVSDQRYAKIVREAERLAASAEKEAKRAAKRAANKLSRASATPEAARPFKKHPVVVSIEKRLARHAKSMDVYRYLDPTVSEDVPRPSLEDIADFLNAIEKTTYEVALWCGKSGLNLLAKLSELLDLVVKAFPESGDIQAPSRPLSVKSPAKPLCEAENRV